MVKKLTSKVNFYLSILDLFKQGKNTTEVSKELNISKQKLTYHTHKLRELGFLEKDKNIWIVKNSKKADLEHTLNWKDKQIRGHAFIWKVKPIRNYDWKLLLEKNNINYKLVRGYTPRIFIKNKKVWLGKETIAVYENKSFYGKNALESRKYAVIELIEVLRELQRQLGISFKYFFRTTREHFGLIKNELAQQLNRKNEKLIIRDNLDGEWLWVDDSEGMLGELETGGKGFTQDRAKLNIGVQKWYNDHKKHNFEVTSSFILNSLNILTQTQQKEAEKWNFYAKHIESHTKAIIQLSNKMDKLIGIKKENIQLKKEKSNQTKLGEFL